MITSPPPILILASPQPAPNLYDCEKVNELVLPPLTQANGSSSKKVPQDSTAGLKNNEYMSTALKNIEEIDGDDSKPLSTENDHFQQLSSQKKAFRMTLSKLYNA